MLCDHDLLIGRDHPGANAAPQPANASAAGAVRLIGQLQFEPGRIATDASTDRDGVFADTACELERVQSGRKPEGRMGLDRERPKT
jgi:hypothetical protein